MIKETKREGKKERKKKRDKKRKKKDRHNGLLRSSLHCLWVVLGI